jgi:hypothetical protein
MTFLAVRTLLALCVLGCSNDATAPLREGGRRVLFVGNSLTYANDLPRTIADMAKSVGDTTLVYRTVAKANHALEDHWYDGIGARIAADDWQVVVMQQGPSSTLTNQFHLEIWTRKLDSVVTAAGARSALYMVWPAQQNFGTYDGVRDSYRNAATVVNGMFIPAGEAWRTAWTTDPNLAFYGDDLFHPSRLGTYMAALVHFEMLYDRPATDLPDVAVVAGRRLDLPAATVAMLQEAAHQTVLTWGIH